MSSEASREIGPVNTLILDFWLPTESQLALFSRYVCGNLLGQQLKTTTDSGIWMYEVLRANI